MKDKEKTKEQLIKELAELRELVSELRASETERKWAEEEQEHLIHEQKQLISELIRLSGLLPVCTRCKRIRDDKKYWDKIISYIQDQSTAESTSNVCPHCG
jgi:DNA repair exonuclease SbcCD ATPase subunit